MDITRALEMLMKLELSAQALYEYYHDLFKTDREAAGCFFTLSLDEKSHADLIGYQIRTIRRNRSLFTDVEFDAGPLNEWISKLEAEIASGKTASLESALRLASELEEHALERQYVTLMAQSNPEVGELITKLGNVETEHLDKLRALATDRGYSVSGS